MRFLKAVLLKLVLWFYGIGRVFVLWDYWDFFCDLICNWIVGSSLIIKTDIYSRYEIKQLKDFLCFPNLLYLCSSLYGSLYMFLKRVCEIVGLFASSWSQFSSVAQSCPTLCDPMSHSTPGLPVHHQPPESTQTHVHRVGDAIQPSHPLSSPSPPAPNPSQHQGLLQWVSSSHLSQDTFAIVQKRNINGKPYI